MRLLRLKFKNKIKADATVKGGVRLFFWSKKSGYTQVKNVLSKKYLLVIYLFWCCVVGGMLESELVFFGKIFTGFLGVDKSVEKV